MDSADEITLAWALLDHSSTSLGEDARMRLCVDIGAGCEREAIRELLEVFAREPAPLPPALTASLWAWIRGFAGSDVEALLAELADRIHTADLHTPTLSDGRMGAPDGEANTATN